jgi:hypothetical protein
VNWSVEFLPRDGDTYEIKVRIENPKVLKEYEGDLHQTTVQPTTVEEHREPLAALSDGQSATWKVPDLSALTRFISVYDSNGDTACFVARVRQDPANRRQAQIGELLSESVGSDWTRIASLLRLLALHGRGAVSELGGVALDEAGARSQAKTTTGTFAPAVAEDLIETLGKIRCFDSESRRRKVDDRLDRRFETIDAFFESVDDDVEGEDRDEFEKFREDVWKPVRDFLKNR